MENTFSIVGGDEWCRVFHNFEAIHDPRDGADGRVETWSKWRYNFLGYFAHFIFTNKVSADIGAERDWIDCVGESARCNERRRKKMRWTPFVRYVDSFDRTYDASPAHADATEEAPAATDSSFYLQWRPGLG